MENALKDPKVILRLKKEKANSIYEDKTNGLRIMQ